MFHLYIIYSKSAGKFYVGVTGEDVNERIRRHNSNHKGYTRIANDWHLVYSEKFDSKSEALKREKQIKHWKSKKAILKLIGAEHPD